MSELRMIRCPACAATNRVPEARLAQGLKPVCGRCKAALPLDVQPSVDGKPLKVTDATFATEVERSPLPVVVRSIPTLLVLRGGHEIDRMVGVLPKSEIARRLGRVAA